MSKTSYLSTTRQLNQPTQGGQKTSFASWETPYAELVHLVCPLYRTEQQILTMNLTS